MPINIESSDGKIATLSIAIDLAPEKPELTEVEALWLVIAEMRGEALSSRGGEALGAITSPEGIRQFLREALTAKDVSDDFRHAFSPAMDSSESPHS